MESCYEYKCFIMCSVHSLADFRRELATWLALPMETQNPLV
jgi:hypothetical protein